MHDQQARFARARVARLATAGADQPHLVPVVFALVSGVVVIAVDHKPKTTTSLKRLRNIEANPRVSMLVDHYDDDWSLLWWVRMDGLGRVLPAQSDDGTTAIDALAGKYPQYVAARPAGPVIAIQPTRWASWSAAG
jgi:PPOX class probable F420-dependent enzyme